MLSRYSYSHMCIKNLLRFESEMLTMHSYRIVKWQYLNDLNGFYEHSSKIWKWTLNMNFNLEIEISNQRITEVKYIFIKYVLDLRLIYESVDGENMYSKICSFEFVWGKWIIWNFDFDLLAFPYIEYLLYVCASMIILRLIYWINI